MLGSAVILTWYKLGLMVLIVRFPTLYLITETTKIQVEDNTPQSIMWVPPLKIFHPFNPIALRTAKTP